MIMSKNEQIYIVDGFVFTSEGEAEKAKKELEGIKFIKEKMNMSNPELVMQIYNKIIKEKMFVTAIGYGYLRDLQEYLRANPSISDDEILPINIVHPNIQESIKEEKQKHQQQLQKVQKKAAKKAVTDEVMEKKYKLSLVVNLILAISVVGMFLISATSKHPTILNYEEKLINRYSAWEQELTEREAALKEMENQ